MLSEVKALLKERESMSLRELAIHFSMKSDALKPMLQLLVEKKQVRAEEIGCGAGCAGCSCMRPADALQYELNQKEETENE